MVKEDLQNYKLHYAKQLAVVECNIEMCRASQDSYNKGKTVLLWQKKCFLQQMMSIVGGHPEDISVQEESEADASGSPEPNVELQNISIEEDASGSPEPTMESQNITIEEDPIVSESIDYDNYVQELLSTDDLWYLYDDNEDDVEENSNFIPI
jgi:hypothetical protein